MLCLLLLPLYGCGRWTISYIGADFLAAAYAVLVVRTGRKEARHLTTFD